jgi:protoheme IX farnesyltransferase
VVALGAALGGGGVTYLALALPQPLAAAVAAVALVTYVFLYTPLKHKTTLNTLVGAIPGALPPVIGWTAMRGALGPEIVALFFIVFLWQVPHFLAIAWIYREDYAQAGMRMLPVVDRLGVLTGRQMVNYCLALIPASLAPAVLGLGGPLYAGGAILLGLFFLSRALGFRQSTSVDQARRVLRASLVYLPALFALLLLDGLSALSALAFWP